LPRLDLNCDGFEIETVMNVRAAKAGLAIHEIPSYEHRRLHGMSNLKVVRDGLRIAKFIIRERSAARQPMSTPEPAVRLTEFSAVALAVSPEQPPSSAAIL